MAPTAGNDTFYGDSRANTFGGGAGTDVLYGLAGDDTYLFNRGDGQDRIWDGSYSSFGGYTNSTLDTVQLGAGITTGEVTVTQADSGRDLVITFAGNASDKIILDDSISDPSNRIEQLKFADGTTWAYATLFDKSVTPTAGSDTFYGDSRANTFGGGAGDDVLYGLAGDDIYLFNRGDGQDRIWDGSYSSFGGYTNSTLDTVQLGVGITTTEITVTQADSGRDLVITFAGNTTDKIILDDSISDPSNRVEQLKFADGTVWDYATLFDKSVAPTAGNDTFYGDSRANTLGGGVGSDYLQGNAGHDIYLYNLGDGHDRIVDGYSTTDTDKLALGTGINLADIEVGRDGGYTWNMMLRLGGGSGSVVLQDQLSTGYGIEQVQFADGTVWSRTDLLSRYNPSFILGTWGSDVLNGSSGNDSFSGALGDDRFNSGAGSDTYLYTSGDGNDYINDESGSITEVDVLKFTDLNANDLTLSRVGLNLQIKVNGIGQAITIDEQFYSQSANWGLEKFIFADGTSWDLATINSKAWIRGGDGNDTLTGSIWNDTFSGGLGDDRFNSGAGSDTYLYTSGDGNDYINDESGSITEVDVLKFTDLNANDLTLSRVGLNLQIKVNGIGQAITIDEQFYSQSANWGLEKFIFADGTSWDLATINSKAWIRGTAGNDTIGGSIWNDVIYGDAGNDLLTGGAGSDTFVFRPNFGKDIISDFQAGAGTPDLIEFSTSVFDDMAAVLARAGSGLSDSGAGFTSRLKHASLLSRVGGGEDGASIQPGSAGTSDRCWHVGPAGG